MKIRLAALAPGQNELVEKASPTDLGLDPSTFPQDLEILILADKGSNKIQLKVNPKGDGHFYCDRCGEDFVMQVGGESQVVFMQRDEPLPDEMPGDDLRTYQVHTDVLDITTEIRDAVMLSIPLKLLCKEDCRGLCLKCRANLNREACRCKPSA